MNKSQTIHLTSVVIVCVHLLTGCEQTRPFDDLWVAPRPYHAEMSANRPAADVMAYNNDVASRDATENPEGAITLHEAIKLALLQSPKLAAAGWRVTAAEANANQMGRPPNPRAGFAVENFSGPSSGNTFERQTLRLSQVIELADKRVKRLKLGQARQRLRAWDYEEQRVKIAAEAATGFVLVAIAQERVKLAEQQLKLAETGFEIADERVRNGINPGLEKDKATARVALSQIALEQARQALNASRADLAAVWGADKAAFKTVDAKLDVRQEVPDLEKIKDRLVNSPSVIRWEDEIAARRQDVALQRANAIADPTIGAGLRYFPDAEDTAGLFEISLPLTLLDDNRDGILSARLSVAEAYAQKKDARAQASRALTRAYSRLQAAEFSLRSLNEKAIPASQSAYEAALDSYQAGVEDYLSVLDAERTLLEIRHRYLDATQAYHLAVIEVERITAHPISEIDGAP